MINKFIPSALKSAALILLTVSLGNLSLPTLALDSGTTSPTPSSSIPKAADALVLDPKTTALVLIDLQRGIVGHTLAPYSATDVVARGAKLASTFRQKGAPVVYVHVDIAQIVRPLADVSMMPPNAPPPPPEASELVPESGVQSGDIVVLKKSWGAFTKTNLEQELANRGIKTIVLLGIATNFGVESTAREAVALGYNLIVVEDATTSLSAELHHFSIDNILKKLGRVRTTEQVLESMH